MVKIGVIIQARISSTRLPRKVLKELPAGSGITVLQQIIRRLKKCKNVHEIIVATSIESSDDEIITEAQKENTKTFRGSLEDVLGRYYSAAQENGLDVIVRITADCPCVDPNIVDAVISMHIEEGAEYTSNVIKRIYPVGFDVEVLDFGVLKEIYKKSHDAYEREHVTLYIHRNSDCFKLAHLEVKEDFYAPDKRVTLDTAEDYVFLCALYDKLYTKNKYFGLHEVMEFLKEEPSGLNK